MCISAQALALFLSMLDPEIVTTEPSRVTVAATEGAAIWEPVGDKWCSDAPDAPREDQKEG